MPVEVRTQMSDAYQTESSDHAASAGHDEHGHADERLGPIDVAAWGAGVLGVAIAGVMAIAFAMATSVPV